MPTEDIPQNSMAISLDPSKKSFVQEIFLSTVCVQNTGLDTGIQKHTCVALIIEVCQSLLRKVTYKI